MDIGFRREYVPLDDDGSNGIETIQAFNIANDDVVGDVRSSFNAHDNGTHAHLSKIRVISECNRGSRIGSTLFGIAAQGYIERKDVAAIDMTVANERTLAMAVKFAQQIDVMPVLSQYLYKTEEVLSISVRDAFYLLRSLRRKTGTQGSDEIKFNSQAINLEIPLI